MSKKRGEADGFARRISIEIDYLCMNDLKLAMHKINSEVPHMLCGESKLIKGSGFKIDLLKCFKIEFQEPRFEVIEGKSCLVLKSMIK